MSQPAEDEPGGALQEHGGGGRAPVGVAVSAPPPPPHRAGPRHHEAGEHPQFARGRRVEAGEADGGV